MYAGVVPNARYSLVKGERIVRSVLSTRLHGFNVFVWGIIYFVDPPWWRLSTVWDKSRAVRLGCARLGPFCCFHTSGDDVVTVIILMLQGNYYVGV
jgi:hypothetical protein